MYYSAALMCRHVCEEVAVSYSVVPVSSVATLAPLYARLQIHLKAELIFSELQVCFWISKSLFSIPDTHLVLSLISFKQV